MYRPAFHSSHPDATDTESDATSTGSDTDTENSSTEEEIQVGTRRYDQLMQARDEWTSASQAWIPGTGRITPSQSIVAPRASSGGVVAAVPRPDATAIPQELRANDIRRHVINVDSQFREDPLESTSSNFYFRLLNPVKNVLRVRVTAIEFPNNYKFFTRLRRNVSIRIGWRTSSHTLVIEDGNYNAYDMQDRIQEFVDEKFGLNSIKVTWDEVRAVYVFVSITGTITISLPTDVRNSYYDRLFAYGLGYYIGFSYNNGEPHVSTADPSGNILISDSCANFAGDPYVFLKVNDFNCVVQNVGDNDFHALAKIVLREPKNYMAFDDYASQHIKEVVFQSPRDLSRFHIQVVDPYGVNIDLCSAHVSFSMEVLEIQNHTLYDTVRDSIMLRYV
jgi:hypothetical protein